MSKITIIIPVHNEEDNIVSFVERFIADIPSELKNIIHQILLVENGSTDKTLNQIQVLLDRYPQLIKFLTIKQGSYGEAIKKGILETITDHLIILELDFLDISFIEGSIKLFNQNKKFIVASKQHPDSVDNRPLKRKFLTFIFNIILKIVFKYPGTDTHGLKAIETKLAKKLCNISLTSDEIFQTEIVFLAWKLGNKINELPIEISEKRSTPVSIIKRSPKLFSLIKELKRSLNRKIF